MGSHSLPSSSMTLLLLFPLVASVLGVPMPPPLGDTTGHAQYNPIDQDHYAPNELYKSRDMQDCHYVDKLVYKDECVPYVEKTCYTQQEEHCEDRTCIFSVDFECGKPKEKDGKNSVSCDKVPTKKCYDTPRKIREEVCKPRVSKYCEKFTNEFPYPGEKQNCHSEPMKTCGLETRQRPKKAKDYVYHKECKPIKRQVCDDCEKKKLRATCDKIQRNVCSYKPKEKCVDEPKKYCFKTEGILHEKVCLSEKKVIMDETLSHV